MICTKALLAAGIILLSVSVSSAQEKKQGPSEDERQAGPQTETVVGVIDQTGEKFVLATEDRIRPIAKLQGERFSNSNFARFVGLKVRIKGEFVGSGEDRVLKVRDFKDIERIGPTTKQ